MKILKYLLAIILLLIIIFFGKGVMTPSVSYENEIIVNKSAQESWDVMSDDANLPKWISGFVKSELISGSPNTKGAVSKVYVNEKGQESVMEETIIDAVENKLLSMHFTMDFMDMDYEMSFDENNGKTTIRTKSKAIGNGLFAKSLISFMKGGMTSQEDKNLGNLKKLIDENTKRYGVIQD